MCIVTVDLSSWRAKITEEMADKNDEMDTEIGEIIEVRDHLP